MTDLDRFNTFVSLMQNNFPKLQIKYKNESNFMKLLSKILFFNKNFMHSYITTIGNSVYFPNKQHIENNPIESIIILAHECYHIKDAKKFNSFIFIMLYLVPQLFALLFIPMLFILGWWALLFLLFLVPIPSPGRAYFEFHGYTMTLFMCDQVYRELGMKDQKRKILLRELAEKIKNTNFAGPGYYFMWPFNLSSQFDKVINMIDSGDILDNDDLFRFVKAALEQSKSLS